MDIQQSIRSELNRLQKILDDKSFRVAIEEASRLLNQNTPNIEDYTRFLLNTKFIENASDYFRNESFEYIKNDVPDLYIDTTNAASAMSAIQNLNIPLTSITPVVTVRKIFPDIDYDQAYSFIDFLSEFPMLGYMNDIGIRIFDYISACPKVLQNNVELFRLRKAEFGKKTPYTTREMIGAPYGISKQNRFNSVGIGVAYYSTKIIPEEIDLKEGEAYTSIKVELIREYVLLDVRNLDIPLFFLCHDKAENKNENYNKKYVLSNYITDCAKKSGYDGIIYNSIVEKNIANYAFFDLVIKDLEIIEKLDYNWA
jgi:hypothetical protein